MCRTLTAPVRTIGWASNPYVFGGIGLLLVLQVGFVHLPVMQALFRTADLTATDWLLAAAAGAAVIPVVSAEKAWRRRSAIQRRVAEVDASSASSASSASRRAAASPTPRPGSS